MKIEHVEVKLSNVLKFYAESFQSRIGEPDKPRYLNAFVDIAKDTVVFVVATNPAPRLKE